MKAYPYIGELKSGSGGIVLFADDGFGAQLNSKGSGWGENGIHIYLAHREWDECEFKNITTDYLRNTYGKVESKEHAEFIVKLAELNGAEVVEPWSWGKSFTFSPDDANGLILGFYDEAEAKDDGEKLITLPLPPKEHKEPESKEWPVVGDEVLTPSGQAASIIAIDCNEAWVKYENSSIGSGYASVAIATLTKPPTPEEDLRVSLAEFFISSNEDLARAIINGEIKGLSYKPE